MVQAALRDLRPMFRKRFRERIELGRAEDLGHAFLESFSRLLGLITKLLGRDLTARERLPELVKRLEAPAKSFEKLIALLVRQVERGDHVTRDKTQWPAPSASAPRPPAPRSERRPRVLALLLQKIGECRNLRGFEHGHHGLQKTE
jgi:hypothetical protein